MFTTIDKALAAAVMGIVSLIAIAFPAVREWVTPETVTIIVSILTPVIVWAIPNRPPQG